MYKLKPKTREAKTNIQSVSDLRVAAMYKFGYTFRYEFGEILYLQRGAVSSEKLLQEFFTDFKTAIGAALHQSVHCYLLVLTFEPNIEYRIPKYKYFVIFPNEVFSNLYIYRLNEVFGNDPLGKDLLFVDASAGVAAPSTLREKQQFYKGDKTTRRKLLCELLVKWTSRDINIRSNLPATTSNLSRYPNRFALGENCIFLRSAMLERGSCILGDKTFDMPDRLAQPFFY